jgi:hypothetical protein
MWLPHVALVAVLALLAAPAAAWNFTTALDEYIALPDPNYSYVDLVCSNCLSESVCPWFFGASDRAASI